LVFIAGCAGDKALERAAIAAAKEVDASATARAIEVTQEVSKAPLPPLPGDCTGQERTGVQEADGADVALIKSDRAVGRANDRVRRCAAFYEDIAEARQ